MAVKFLEPGGDATFNVADTGNGGFWTTVNTTPSVVTDFVHGSHIKSIKFRPGFGDFVSKGPGILADGGTRYSVYIYLAALPSATATIVGDDSNRHRIRITSAGVLQLWSTAQLGIDGPTLSIGVWYRISIAYTIASTSVNRFEVFVDGFPAISVTNGTLSGIGASTFRLGNANSNATLDFRFSDLYIDDSSSLRDTGDIWVTAKRPNANGTINGFSTQIGSGGSGYGSGHSPQVNERALSTTNGWSMVGVGAAVTEEYNIEGKGMGDIDISQATIINYIGWVSAAALAAGETLNIIINGVNFSQTITTAIVTYLKVAGSAVYPAGTGADIGIQTDTDLTTVSLYECGILVAFIPRGNMLLMFK